MGFLITRNIAGNIEKLILRGLNAVGIPVPPSTGPGGIVVGLVTTLLDGIEYALPPNLVNVTVITSSGTIEISLDSNSWEAMTLDSNKNFDTAAIFIRSSGGNSTIIAKAYGY